MNQDENQANKIPVGVPEQNPAMPPPKLKIAPRMGESNNERMVREMMQSVGTKGDPRDYVILSGSRLIDFAGGYELRSPKTGGSMGVKGVAVMHKKHLAKFVAKEFARVFWNPWPGGRTPVEQRNRLLPLLEKEAAAETLRAVRAQMAPPATKVTAAAVPDPVVQEVRDDGAAAEPIQPEPKLDEPSGADHV